MVEFACRGKFVQIIKARTNKFKQMKHLFLFCFLIIGGTVIAQDTFSVHVEKVEWKKDKDQRLIHITLKNTGQNISYPVVQVEVNGKIIANEAGTFSRYLLDVEDFTYVFKTDLEEPKELLNCRILVKSGNSDKVLVAISTIIRMDLKDFITVSKVEFEETKDGNYFNVTLTNHGEFISYPVVQVKHNDKIIANKKGIFETYGIGKDMTYTYRLATNMKKMPKNKKCVIFLSEGHDEVPLAEIKAKIEE